MANKYTADKIHGHLLEVTPPGDYGLKKDDGFDPSKYDFYNPPNRNLATTFVVHLDEQNLSAETTPYEAQQTSPDIYETDSPQPLSPIEEFDDDHVIPISRRDSDRHNLASCEVKGSKTDDLLLEKPLSSNDNANEPIEPLEKRSELLFSREHLQVILADSILSLKFSDFLRTYRPDSVPILAYYLDAVKALKTIKYAEAIIKGLEPIPGHAFTSEANSATMAWVMEDKADRALDVLVKDDLPAFIAYVYVRTVDVALVDRVTGNENMGRGGVANGLAEVFVISDPSRPDNPIVFTSEEFHRMTGYSRSEFLGRNCRTLGGARTSPLAITRFRASLDAEREHCEVLLNYRKDGSPFINLIMCVPLRDQSGKVRYYLGAQLDITSLVNECTGLASLKEIIERNNANRSSATKGDFQGESLQRDEFEQLSEAFNPQELEKLILLRRRRQLQSEEGILYSDFEKRHRRHGLLSRTPFADPDTSFQLNGQGSAPPLGYYKTYLLVRPYPSLRILFASPDLRIAGILQSPLLSRIGGSTRVRRDLAHALEVGRKVTAKVQWMSKTSTTSQARWIHCTPLLGANDTIGVWMVILVDDEGDREEECERLPYNTRNDSQRGCNYMAETLPWDERRQKADSSFASIGIGSDTAEAQSSDEVGRSKARRPMFGQPLEMANFAQQPYAVVPGANLDGRASSVTSSSDQPISVDEGKRTSVGSADNRPTSQGSVFVPIQSTMQPKVKIAGRSSLDANGSRRAPIKMPGRSGAERETSVDARPSARRTYKSLSPYGILFED